MEGEVEVGAVMEGGVEVGAVMEGGVEVGAVMEGGVEVGAVMEGGVEVGAASGTETVPGVGAVHEKNKAKILHVSKVTSFNQY